MGYSCTISGKTLHEHDKSKPLILPFLISMSGHAHYNNLPGATVRISFQKTGPQYYISDIELYIPKEQYALCGEILRKMNIPYLPDLIQHDVQKNTA
jgi:hypothetical protein